MAKNKGGRPTVMTTEVVKKLEEVFAIGGSDEEACFYADISRQTLYDYQKIHPEFVDRKEALKEKPVLKARQTLVKSLDTPDMALKYLERKKPKEFSPKLGLGLGEDFDMPTSIKIEMNGISSKTVSPASPSVGISDGQRND